MATTKKSEEIHYHGGKTSPLKSTFQVIHRFSCRCHKVFVCVCVCNNVNVGLRFVLLEQTRFASWWQGAWWSLLWDGYCLVYGSDF